MAATETGGAERVSLGIQAAVYATGIFANSGTVVVWVLMPLWLVSLEASPFEVGIAIGWRSVLPFFLAIPGGAAMDRVGVKRLVLVSAAFGVLIPPLFPLLPWVAAVIALQTVSGIPGAMGWIGCQAMLGQVMKGDPLYTGRMSFYLRIGTLFGPILTGAAWDFYGPWGGFGILTLWSLFALIAAVCLPDVRPQTEPVPAGGPAAPKRRAAINLRDYADALRLLLIPLIALVVMVSLMRMSAATIVGSFYVVYLKQIGYTGSVIGLLIGSGQLISAGGALLAAPLARYLRDYWVLIGATALSIMAVMVTPLLTAFIPLLIAAGLRGLGTGLTQPLMISIGQKAAGIRNQGKSAALRTSINRVAEALVPITMGAVAQLYGIEDAFLIVCGVLMVAVIAVALTVFLRPEING